MTQILRLGADPELVPAQVVSGTTDPNWWSQYGFVLSQLGTKESPMPLPGGIGSTIQRDGGSVELGFRPCDSSEMFLATLDQTKHLAEVMCGMPLLGVARVELGPLLPHIYDAGMEEYYSEFGCDPDYQLQHGELVLRDVPNQVREAQVQECGFHLHFDIPRALLRDSPNHDGIGAAVPGIVKRIDEAIYPIYQANATISDSAWYRQRGIVRVKNYGIEYRSLGGDVYDAPYRQDIVDAAFDILSSLAA